MANHQVRLIMILSILFLTLGCIGELSEADDYLTETQFGQLHGDHTMVTINSSNTWYHISDLNGEHLRGMTVTDGNITLSTDGNYTITGSISFDGGANQEYHIAIFKNNVWEPTCTMERVIGSGADVGAGPIQCIQTGTAGDEFSLHVRNETGTGNTTMHHLIIDFVKLSD